MRIVIVGVTGFVGKSLLRFLNQHRDEYPSLEVIGYSSQTDTHSDLRRDFDFVECREWNVLSGPTLFPVCDLVFHLANPASAEMIQNAPEFMFKTITLGTINLIESIGSTMSRPVVVLASSGAVYNWALNSNSPVSELGYEACSTTSPESSYGEAKRASELLLSIADSRDVLSLKIARMFAFGGVDLPINAHFALGNFVSDVINNRPIGIQGNPETVRSYLSSNDMSHWLMRIAIAGGRRSIYHVGSEVEVTIGELALLVAKIAFERFGISLPVVQDEVGRQRTRSYYVPDTKMTRSELGLNETEGLEQIIGRMIEHHLSGSK